MRREFLEYGESLICDRGSFDTDYGMCMGATDDTIQAVTFFLVTAATSSTDILHTASLMNYLTTWEYGAINFFISQEPGGGGPDWGYFSFTEANSGLIRVGRV